MPIFCKLQPVIRVALWLACFSVAGGTAVSAQTSPAAGKVLLLAAADDPHAAEAALKLALHEGDPVVRLFAARVAAAGKHEALLPHVLAALSDETDARAGTEMVRAALLLGGAPVRERLQPYVNRFGPPARAAAAEWLARSDAPRFVDTLPELVLQLGPAAGRLGPLVSLVHGTHADLRSKALSAWMTLAPAGSWYDMLMVAYPERTSIDAEASVFIDALKSEREQIREETLWFLVASMRNRRRIPAAVLDAATTVPEAATWERFARELLARNHRKLAVRDRTDWLRTQAASAAARSAAPGFPELTKGERAVFDEMSGPRETVWDARQPLAPVRTLSFPVSGAVVETLDAAQCNLPLGDLASADVTFAADGRPGKIQLTRGTRLDARCERAFIALLRATVADAGFGGQRQTQLIVLPFHESFLGCVGAVSHPRDLLDGHDPVVPPALIREIKPPYPAAAHRNHIEGVVTIDVRMTDRGCVASATIVDSIPALDASALWAVTQWLFRPPAQDAVARPTTATVAITFTPK